MALSNTYVMTDDEYIAWFNSGTPDTNLYETTYLVENDVYNDPYFQFFYCGGTLEHNYACAKF